MPTGEHDQTRTRSAAGTVTVPLVPDAIGDHAALQESLVDTHNRPRQPSRLWTFAFFLIVAVGIFFRFYKMEQKEFWADEAYTSLIVSGHVRDEFRDSVCTGKPILAGALLAEFQTPHGPIMNAARDSVDVGGHHPPVYFIMARVWAQLFGSSITAMRILPALFSVLTLPAVYWLCLELFESAAIARIAVALNAVSPFMVLHAQNAREYSLWICLTAVCSAVFIRAIKRQRRNDWIAYAMLSAASFYTYSFSLFVSASHFLCVLCTEKLRMTRPMTTALKGMLLTVLLCAPWLSMLLAKRSTVIKHMEWLQVKLPLPQLAHHWKSDVAWIFAQVQDRSVMEPISNAILALAALFIGILLVRAQRLQRNFVLCLIACSILPLLIPDLLFGGIRSMILRYMMPAVLGISLTFAFGLWQLLAARAKSARALGAVILTALVAGGIGSCFSNSQIAQHPQFTMGQNLAAVATTVNRSPDLLMICNASGQPGETLALARLLRSDIPLVLERDDESVELPQGHSKVYVFDASPYKGIYLGLEYNFDRSSKTPYFGTISMRSDPFSF
jgi:uncharacterized membrane protein